MKKKPFINPEASHHKNLKVLSLTNSHMLLFLAETVKNRKVVGPSELGSVVFCIKTAFVASALAKVGKEVEADDNLAPARGQGEAAGYRGRVGGGGQVVGPQSQT